MTARFRPEAMRTALAQECHDGKYQELRRPNERHTRTVGRCLLKQIVAPRAYPGNWVRRRQNSLPSGSASTCHPSSPLCPISTGRAPAASSQQPRELSILITTSRIDVEVQAELSGLGARRWPEHDCGLKTAESGPRRPDLDTALYLFKLNEPEHLAPEGCQPGRITAVDHQLAYPACHTAMVPTGSAVADPYRLILKVPG
jgi:hypothetical protein